MATEPMREWLKRNRSAFFAIMARAEKSGRGVSGGTFEEHGLPMVVSCTGCEMTMTLFSARISEDRQLWCSDCSGHREVDEQGATG
jgi:hypothetical protein